MYREQFYITFINIYNLRGGKRHYSSARTLCTEKTFIALALSYDFWIYTDDVNGFAAVGCGGLGYIYPYIHKSVQRGTTNHRVVIFFDPLVHAAYHTLCPVVRVCIYIYINVCV